MTVKKPPHSGTIFNGPARPSDEILGGPALVAGAALGVLAGVIIAIVTVGAATIAPVTSGRLVIVCAVVASGAAVAVVRHRRRRRGPV